MTSLEEFYEELNEYLDSKIPDTDISVRRELAVFVVQRVAIRERDVAEDVARQFRYSMGSHSGRSKHEVMERNKEYVEEMKKRINYAEESEKETNK